MCPCTNSHHSVQHQSSYATIASSRLHSAPPSGLRTSTSKHCGKGAHQQQEGGLRHSKQTPLSASKGGPTSDRQQTWHPQDNQEEDRIRTTSDAMACTTSEDGQNKYLGKYAAIFGSYNEQQNKFFRSGYRVWRKGRKILYIQSQEWYEQEKFIPRICGKSIISLGHIWRSHEQNYSRLVSREDIKSVLYSGQPRLPSFRTSWIRECVSIMIQITLSVIIIL